MVKKVLITRPKHDVITSYLHDFSKEIIRIIKKSSDIHVTNLDGTKATRINLEKSLSNENPKLVFLNGHGVVAEDCPWKEFLKNLVASGVNS